MCGLANDFINNGDFKYCLRAINNEGSKVELYADTQKELLEDFDAEYFRTNFKIQIENRYTGDFMLIKSTFGRG